MVCGMPGLQTLIFLNIGTATAVHRSGLLHTGSPNTKPLDRGGPLRQHLNTFRTCCGYRTCHLMPFVQGLVAAMVAAGVVGLLGVTTGLANNKTCARCERY